MFRFFDDTDEVLAWSSEELVIPYISRVDGKQHRYFTDAVIWVKTPTGVKKKIIEIKPESETKKPVRGKNQTDQAYMEDVRTYIVNQCKWAAAREYAAKDVSDFLVLTEKHIFPSNHSLPRYKQPKKKAG